MPSLATSSFLVSHNSISLSPPRWGMSDHVQNDFGLSEIAAHFGRSIALETYYEGSALEAAGDVDGAIVLYRRAYRLWPGMESDSQIKLNLLIFSYAPLKSVGFRSEGWAPQLRQGRGRGR